MELSPSCEANSYRFTQEFTNILWNHKVYYHLYKTPPLVALIIIQFLLFNTELLTSQKRWYGVDESIVRVRLTDTRVLIYYNQFFWVAKCVRWLVMLKQ
jgi:hypothetical protein